MRAFRPLRWLAVRSPREYQRADRSRGPYSLISASPPIFYVKYWVDENARIQCCFDALFERVRGCEAYFLYSWRWEIEDPDRIALAKQLEAEHQRRHPRHVFIHLCNTQGQTHRFREAGLIAAFCSQNALVDERLFRPIPGLRKRFDAVYDARMRPYKRHELASEIQSLALIHDVDSNTPDDEAYADRMGLLLSHAHSYNRAPGVGHGKLTPQQVAQCLNECRVGLCLSGVEGAMYASVQYLLCGLPVVSTQSRGGRDVFFDDDFVSIVDDDAGAVRDGVCELIRRGIPADQVRDRTLEKLRWHRGRFISIVQEIYDRQGLRRSFASEWNDIFFDKLFREDQSHDEALAQL